MRGGRWVALATVALCAAGCAGGTPGGGATAASAHRAPVAQVPRQVWRWDAPAPGSVGMPASDGRSVAFTFGHVGLVLLEGEGRETWRAMRPGLRPTAPLLAPTLVAVATEDGIVAYGRADGRERWYARLGERPNSPVELGGLLVVTTWDPCSASTPRTGRSAGGRRWEG